MTKRYTAVEVYRDGHREVYHRDAEPFKIGWAWTHADTPQARADCTMCTHGTLESIRRKERNR